MDLLPWGNVPKELTRRLNVCAVDVVLGYYTHYELDRLDKYARGELHISDSELKQMEDDVEDRMGGEDELTSKMRERCPDVVKDADAYKKAHS